MNQPKGDIWRIQRGKEVVRLICTDLQTTLQEYKERMAAAGIVATWVDFTRATGEYVMLYDARQVTQCAIFMPDGASRAENARMLSGIFGCPVEFVPAHLLPTE